jgi:hypothetical protein
MKGLILLIAAFACAVARAESVPTPRPRPAAPADPLERITREDRCSLWTRYLLQPEALIGRTRREVVEACGYCYRSHLVTTARGTYETLTYSHERMAFPALIVTLIDDRVRSASVLRGW